MVLLLRLAEALRLHLTDRDLEGSARAEKAMHSKIEEKNVRKLYSELNALDPLNPCICNLGVELGVY